LVAVDLARLLQELAAPLVQRNSNNNPAPASVEEEEVQPNILRLRLTIIIICAIVVCFRSSAGPLR
jgi:hypothetical protein